MKRIATGTILLTALVAALFLGANAEEANNLTLDDQNLRTVRPFVSGLSEAVNDKPPYDGPPNIPDPDKTRQGGEDLASAISITEYELPYSALGSTAGYVDDYDEACPWGSNSPDVVYEYIPMIGVDHSITISLCNDGTDYDTKLWVYDQDGSTVIDCSDDYCTTGPGQQYVSELVCVPIIGSSSKYIVVDGYGGNFGNYEITVSYCEPCTIECPPGAISENEPCGDDVNGGCSSDPVAFGTVACGDTICGTAWAEGGTRDTDWYEFVLTDATTITVTGCAEFSFMLGFVDTSDCALAANVDPAAFGNPCDTISVSRFAGPGTYWVWAGSQSSEDTQPCGTDNDYWFTLQYDCAASAITEIVLDHVDGLAGPGELQVNTPINFHIRKRYITNDGSSIYGFSTGFRVYSPDGADWQPITFDTASLGWPDMFDLGFYVHQRSITGSGADSLGFGGVILSSSGLTDPFDEIVWSISTQVGDDQAGKTLCLDSCFYPPNGVWLWGTTGPLETVLPGWDGPHCFEIASCCDLRGDANDDEQINIIDMVHIVDYLSGVGDPPPCMEEGDANADGLVNVTDVQYLARYLFSGGPPPLSCESSISPGTGPTYNIELLLNGSPSGVANIGDTNRLEIYLWNLSGAGPIYGFSLGFSFEIASAYSFDASYGDIGNYLKHELGSYFNPNRWAIEGIDNVSPDSWLIGGSAWPSDPYPGSAGTPVFSLQFYIPPGESPQVDGICIGPISYPEGGTWTTTGLEGLGSPPKFNGGTVYSQTEPELSGESYCFDIVGPDIFESFEVVANASGVLDPPLPGALASAGFPTPENVDPGSDQQVKSATWALHTADNGGSSGGGTRGDYGSFKSRVLRSDNAQDVANQDFEMRFTYPAGKRDEGSLAIRAFTDEAAIPVPFELWRIGSCTPDDPSDDVRMTVYILEWDDNGWYDLENWGTSSNGGGGYEHSASPGDDDPYLDWIYWVLPADSTPGESGYLADKAAILAGTYAYDGEEVMARTVLIRVDASGGPGFDPVWPESGTVFRITTTKSEPCGCCVGIRANVNNDPGDDLDISDLVYLVDYMFTGGPPPTCWPEANVNGLGLDESIDISDLVYLVDYMFTGGPPPPACQ